MRRLSVCILRAPRLTRVRYTERRTACSDGKKSRFPSSPLPTSPAHLYAYRCLFSQYNSRPSTLTLAYRPRGVNPPPTARCARARTACSADHHLALVYLPNAAQLYPTGPSLRLFVSIPPAPFPLCPSEQKSRSCGRTAQIIATRRVAQNRKAWRARSIFFRSLQHAQLTLRSGY